MTERLGIVYTPVEVVDFILHSVDHLLQQEFGQTWAARACTSWTRSPAPAPSSPACCSRA
jgi:predicted helicase